MKVISAWWSQPIPGPGTLVVDLEATPEHLKNAEHPIVFWMVEPFAMMPKIRAYIEFHSHLYDWILTSDEIVMQHCANNAIYFNCCNNWITEQEYRSVNVNKKMPRISTVVGGKRQCIGHQLRLNLYMNQDKIKNLDTFHSTNCPPPTFIPSSKFIFDTKMELFKEYQYSLVIENSQQTNYFTEKLLDCLLTKTIPIYYGCPNISDFFDTTGWIILEDTDISKCIKKINECNFDYCYWSGGVQVNYNKALKYVNSNERLLTVIAELQTIPAKPM